MNRIKLHHPGALAVLTFIACRRRRHAYICRSKLFGSRAVVELVQQEAHEQNL